MLGSGAGFTCFALATSESSLTCTRHRTVKMIIGFNGRAKRHGMPERKTIKLQGKARVRAVGTAVVCYFEQELFFFWEKGFSLATRQEFSAARRMTVTHNLQATTNGRAQQQKKKGRRLNERNGDIQHWHDFFFFCCF